MHSSRTILFARLRAVGIARVAPHRYSVPPPSLGRSHQLLPRFHLRVSAAHDDADAVDLLGTSAAYAEAETQRSEVASQPFLDFLQRLHQVDI